MITLFIPPHSSLQAHPFMSFCYSSISLSFFSSLVVTLCTYVYTHQAYVVLNMTAYIKLLVYVFSGMAICSLGYVPFPIIVFP